MSQKFKRRNYLIKKDFQGKMILGFFLFVIGSIVLFTVIFGLFSADSITMTYKNNDLQLGQTPAMLFKNALAANWVFIVFGGALLIIAALLVSHHIAGPQFRFEKALHNMLAGNLNDAIYLRTHDTGDDLASQINTFNKKLSGQIREIDQQACALEELADSLDKAETSSEDQESIRESCNAIRTHAAAIRQVTNSFTLVDE